MSLMLMQFPEWGISKQTVHQQDGVIVSPLLAIGTSKKKSVGSFQAEVGQWDGCSQLVLRQRGDRWDF